MTKGKIYLILAFVLAGSSVISAKYVINSLQPFTTTALSLFIASLTALLIKGKDICKTLWSMNKKQWLMFFLQALFGNLLYRVFLTNGLKYIGTAEAGIITGTTPAITTVLSFLFLREKPGKWSLPGVFITLSGIFMLQGFPFNLGIFTMPSILGSVLVLMTAFSESIFNILGRRFNKKPENSVNISPVVQSGLVSLFACIMCIIPTILEHPLADIILLSGYEWLALLWYGSIVTIAAFSFFFMGTKYCDGYTIAAFSGITPVSSLLLSIAVLKEIPTIYQVAGCVLIVISTILISRSEQPKNTSMENTGVKHSTGSTKQMHSTKSTG